MSTQARGPGEDGVVGAEQPPDETAAMAGAAGPAREDEVGADQARQDEPDAGDAIAGKSAAAGGRKPRPGRRRTEPTPGAATSGQPAVDRAEPTPTEPVTGPAEPAAAATTTAGQPAADRTEPTPTTDTAPTPAGGNLEATAEPTTPAEPIAGPAEPATAATTTAGQPAAANATEGEHEAERTAKGEPAEAADATTGAAQPADEGDDAARPPARRWRDHDNPEEMLPPAAYIPRRGWLDPDAPPRVRPTPASIPVAEGRRIEVQAVDLDERISPWSQPGTETVLRKAAPGAAAAIHPDKPKVRDPKPKDPWSTFVAREEPPPTRADRYLAATGRFFTHEWVVASLLSLLAAVVMTWPTLRYPLYTIPQDVWDPTLVAWMLSWSGHILITDPLHLWQGNAFYPESWSYAFTDSLLGYAPFGMIGTGPEAAVLRYNIVFVLAHALAALGAYALVRQLGANRTGATVAAAAYAYAPWLLAQGGHLHVISNGAIPLALAMLARGHGYSFKRGYRPEKRHAGWVIAGWLTAAWQLSLGFGVGLAFAYVLAVLVLVVAAACAIRKVWIGRKLFFTDLAGGVVFAAVGGLLAIPYFEVAEAYPNARRTLADVQFFSPPFKGFFTAPPESRIWGESHAAVRQTLDWAPEMTLLPGFVLIGLAAAGLLFSIWTIRQRLLLLALTVVSGVLAMGTKFLDGTFTYVPLFDHLPGWDGLRTPGRLVLYTTLFLGILAAGAVSAFVGRVQEIAVNRVPPWPGPWLRLATLIPLVLVLAEGLNVTPHPTVPVQPAAMRTVDGPLLVLPSNPGTDSHVMLWSTTKFQDVVNGSSGFNPPRLDEIRQVTQTFPDPTSIDYLRQLGVRNVVILRDRVAGTPWQTSIDLPVDALGIQREDLGESVVYRL
jgi:hypothetical protein